MMADRGARAQAPTALQLLEALDATDPGAWRLEGPRLSREYLPTDGDIGTGAVIAAEWALAYRTGDKWVRLASINVNPQDPSGPAGGVQWHFGVPWAAAKAASEAARLGLEAVNL